MQNRFSQRTGTDSQSSSAGADMILAGATGQTNLSFTQYLLVHELGHIFDNRTTSANCSPTSATLPCRLLNLALQGVSSGVCPTYLRDSLRIDAISTPPPNVAPLVFQTTCVDLVDSQLRAVMGRPNGTFARGERGWGTSPDNIFTDFQQHPGEVFRSDSSDLVLEETAADMFLNWVYRIVTNIPTSFRTGVPGSWLGYRNMSWRDNIEGTTLASIAENGDFTVIAPNQNTLLFQFSGGASIVDAAVTWSSDGNRLATGIGNQVYI